MTILKILQYPDNRLRQKACIVTDPKDSKIQKIIADILETLAATEKCAGLSATQLDIIDPPSITVINLPDQNTHNLCLINPRITAQSGTESGDEGCMSVCPNNIYAKVERAKNITVKALTHDGKTIEINASDFLARCIQHEIDHLNGILYIDHLSQLKRSRIEKKIAKLARS